MIVIAALGAKSLYLLYAWLASAIIASWLSNRKGYGEKPGLATGLLLSAVAVVVWLVMPSRAGSLWKTEGPLPPRNRRVQTAEQSSVAESSDNT
jgi:hypothetical protein